MSAAQRQQNRDVQSALNAFNFPVGTVDGSIGPKSRAAIGNYQAYMGWGATGRLDDYQRGILVDNWRKLQAGAGYSYPNMMQREGARGLLRTALNPQYPAQYGDQVQTFANPQAPVPQDPNVITRNNNQVPQQPIDPNTQTGNGQEIGTNKTLKPLAPLRPKGAAPVSMAARCEVVELTTAAQGPMSPGNITDPNQALSEKFCDARSYSISQGQYVASQYAMSDQEMADNCGVIKSEISPVVHAVSQKPVADVLASVRDVTGRIGLGDAETAALYGQICLGIGYRQDDETMALTSGLILASAGFDAYGEIIGHHTREGFGVTAAPDASLAWYQTAMDALDQGAQPAFEPSSTADRISVIRAAIEQGGVNAGVQTLPRLVPISDQ